MTSRRVVVVTGGPDYAHDFASSGTALVEIAQDEGFAVEVADDPGEAFWALDGAAAVVVNALRWRMRGERYDEWRDEWAYEVPADARAALVDYVDRGGGVVASHTAVICFDDWPGWRDVLGGAWDWERSGHPPPAPVAVGVADHPITVGLPASFTVIDEVYGDLDLVAGIEPLATARRSEGDAPQVVAWAHRFGRGRVVVDTLGHDARSLHHAVHEQLLRGALRWVTQAEDGP